jgi:hypothetical protein
MFEFLKKKVDEYDAGYTLASDMYDYHLASTGSQNEAYEIVSTYFKASLILNQNEEKPSKKKSERFYQGATGFLIQTFQTMWKQIPVDTPHDQAVGMLQFANGISKPETPCVDGYEMAMNLYAELMGLDDFTPLEAIGYINMNYRTIYAKFSSSEKFRFVQAKKFIEGLSIESLEQRAKLEKAYNA